MKGRGLGRTFSRGRDLVSPCPHLTRPRDEDACDEEQDDVALLLGVVVRRRK